MHVHAWKKKRVTYWVRVQRKERSTHLILSLNDLGVTVCSRVNVFLIIDVVTEH